MTLIEFMIVVVIAGVCLAVTFCIGRESGKRDTTNRILSQVERRSYERQRQEKA